MKNIKKILCMIVVCAMTLSLMCFSVSAETEFDVTASVNYDTSVVTIQVTTPAKYVQKISIVMYEKETAVSSPADFVRALEVKTDGSGFVETEIQLAEDDPAGYLVIAASGNGTKAAVSKDTTEIYFESQTYIEEVTLPAIETADRAEIETLLSEKADMLSIDKTDFAENTDVICDLFLNIREADYNNECNDMGTVVNILSGVQLIRDINATTTDEECVTLCEDESTLLTLDTEDSDYSDNKDVVYELFYANAKNEAPETITDVKNDLFQSIAIASLNKLDATKNGPTVEKYIEYFGITLQDYEDACDKYGAGEINKAFVGQDFVLAGEVVKAFEDVVSYNEENSKPSGGGGGGGGGFSGPAKKPDKEVIVDSDLLNENESLEVLPTLPSTSMFNDVPVDHWAFESVNELHSLGVIDGIALNTFDPDSYVTREAFVKMYVMAFDMYDETALTIFTDLLGHWANIYVASAQINGIVKGQDNFTFGVGQPITRQDAAVMLKRVLDFKGITLESGEAKSFSDSGEIAEYAKESVDALASAGVINGMTETQFQPEGKLTRAQAAKLIYGALSR